VNVVCMQPTPTGNEGVRDLAGMDSYKPASLNSGCIAPLPVAPAWLRSEKSGPPRSPESEVPT